MPPVSVTTSDQTGGMPDPDDAADASAVPDGLPRVVADQIVKDLECGPKAIECLRTAARLIAEARQDQTGLRLVESAAYNLREALDAVGAGQTAGPSGMPAVKEAYERYRLASSGPGADEVAALRRLAGDLGRLDADGDLLDQRTRAVLAWLETRTGIKPLPGDDDPSHQLSVLRRKVNGTLHDSGTLPLVAGFYDDAIAWFIRVFTPPDERVQAIVELARTPFTGLAQVAVLRTRIAYNAHHLVRFLSEVRDPAWLDALFDDGLIRPPRDGEPWPITALISGSGGIAPASTVSLLERLRIATAGADPEAVLALDRNVIQLCLRLGPDAHDLVGAIVQKRPKDHWVQRIAVYIAKDADPAAPIQVTVADAVIGGDTTSDASYQTRTMAGLLVDGLNLDNAPARFRLLALKLTRLASEPSVRVSPPGIAALNTPAGDEDLREELLILTERFANAIGTWRDLGLPTSDLLDLVTPIPGDVGERIVCRVLTDAPDVSREAKIAHLCVRVASLTSTGDDRDLLADLGDLAADEIARLAAAFGPPSPAPEPDEHGYVATPPDWARAWRWSMVLPSAVLCGWEAAIAAVTERHGTPDEASLSSRAPRFPSARPESPYTSEQLSALPPIEAAELVAAWRIEPDTGVWGSSVYELGSALESAIAADVANWSADPVGVVTALREPAYIQRYLRVLEKNSNALAGSIGPIMDAVALIRTEPWTPAQITRSRADPDVVWSELGRPIVEMVGAFANAEADLGTHLDLAWHITEELARALPDDLPPLPETRDSEVHDDAFGRAINRTYGQALETAISLGWLGHRRDRLTSPRFADLLDWVLTVPGSVGAELRSVLAAFRPVLEHSAREWLDRRHGDLFGGELGEVTFEVTLKYSRPTTWLYENYRTRIAAAALAGVPNAVALPLIGYLWEIDRFTIPSILGSYKSSVDVLRQTAEEIASLVQDAKVDDPMLARALAFWDGMLDGAGSTVPKSALTGAGRWVFVGAVPSEELIARLDRTTEQTGGHIELATEVADRCRETQPSEAGLRILRRVQGHGEPWEKDHVGRVGVEALAAASGHGLGTEFNGLRDRLIELGFHAAADIDSEPT